MRLGTQLRFKITLYWYSWWATLCFSLSFTFSSNWDDKKCRTWDGVLNSSSPRRIGKLFPQQSQQRRKVPSKGKHSTEKERNQEVRKNRKTWFSSQKKLHHTGSNSESSGGGMCKQVRHESLVSALGQDYWPRWFASARLVSGKAEILFICRISHNA